VPHLAHDETGRTSVFHEFTALRTIPQTEAGERYILFLGFPWLLKGVDILIQAFNRISARHPDVRLRIVGHCPDRTLFEALAAGNPRVSLERAVPREQAMALMAGCSLFVLPSRSEAMGRVLRGDGGSELYCFGRGRYRYYVRDNETGIRATWEC
jgi:glycosyltransferase involved in cell wall biosynthesis